MNLDLGRTVRKINGQASRVTQGQALVVLIEQRKLHRLNAVGTRVWELCDGRDLASIVDVIVAEFEVERAVAAKDVCEFVDTLLGLGALQLGEPSA
jgi:GeoRSP system PqqD family protein